jgi:hypothetical protein
VPSRKRYADLTQEQVEAQRQYHRKWLLAHPDSVRISRFQTKQWAKNNKERLQSTWKKWKYGLQASEYLALIKSQGNVCAICQKPFPKNRAPAADHCHQKGTVRGILCGTCNTGLGMFKDDPKLLSAAMEYLAKF